MKLIHVERIGTTYRARLMTGEESIAEAVLCGGSEQLIAALSNWGTSPIGISDIVKQLESSSNAALRVQEE